MDQRGGAQGPPTAVAIIVVVVADDSGGGVGANVRCPMPHATKGWPADDIATVVVGFPPIVRFLA